MKEYINKIKELFGSNLDQKKKSQNLVLIIILLAISLIAINNIFDDSTNTNTNATTNATTNTTNKSKTNDKKTIVETGNNLENTEYTELEGRLKSILDQISGVDDVSVMLTYSSYGKMIPVYDIKEDVDIEETGVAESNKTSQKTVTEKKVAYEEQNSDRKVIVESRGAPVVEGAIIAAKGANNLDINIKIKEAVSSVTNVPLHKVQVFEK